MLASSQKASSIQRPESSIENGANGMSDMAGNAAEIAVERGGSCVDTMERTG